MRRGVFNARRKKAMKGALKDASKLLSAKSAKEAEKMLPQLYQAIDKAAKNGTIKKNTAARMKKRMSKKLRTLTA